MIRRRLEASELADNPFDLIGRQWMLITAGPPAEHNTMTASWGALGVMWGRPVCWCAVRPQRHTMGYLERNPAFTLSFFGEEHRAALEFCGKNSGRDVDKADATGLTPEPAALDTTTFEQARLVLVCRKLYWQDLDPEHFLDETIQENYPARDYHRMFVAEIVEASLRD